MRGLVRLCVSNPIFVNILMVMIVISGLAATGMMIREMMPTVNMDMITIRVVYPGASPDEVEEGVTLKIEEAIEGLEGVKEYMSTSSEGIGVVTVVVDEFANATKVRDEVTNRVNAIFTLPPDAEEPIVSEVTAAWPVLYIAVHGELPERQLKELAENLKDELQLLDGLSQVAVQGTREYAISIELSEAKLRKYGLTFDRVGEAVRAASENFPGGSIRNEAERINIRTMGRRYTGEEFANIVLIADERGASIRLGDVADIRDGFEEDEILTRFNGNRSALLVVSRTENEDALRIKDEIVRFVAEQNRMLPETVGVDIWGDTSIYITQRINLLLKNGVIGLSAVFLLLWIFLDLRLAFWVSIGIPISFAGGLAIMGIFDQTINMISLFALIMVLGILVDDAIVVGEAVYVQRRRGLAPADAAVEGAAEVGWPVVAAVLTTIVAFVPMLFVSGIMGKFIRVLPIAVIAALLVSLVECLIVLPAHLRDLPSLNQDEVHARERGLTGWRHRLRDNLSRSLEWFAERIYAPLVRRVLYFRYVGLATAIAIFAITIGMFAGGRIKFSMFPDTDTNVVMVDVEFPNGTPLEVTLAALEKIEDGIEQLNETMPTGNGQPLVDAMFTMAGQQISYQPGAQSVATGADSHLGQIIVELLEPELRNIHFQEIINAWRDKVGPIPGALNVEYRTEQGGPGGADLEVWVRGVNLPTLQAAANEIKDRLADYEGVYQIKDDFRPGKRELRATLKSSARNLGITTADLGRQLRYGFYGNEVMRVQRQRENIKIWLRYPLDERRSLGDVDRIRIRTATGEEVPLSAVADVTLEQGYSDINRFDGRRRISVTASINPSIANSADIVANMKQDFLPALTNRYPGIAASFEGEQADTTESLGSLMVGFPLAMVGIYMILATMFRSYLQPVVIMATIPFGIIGAVWGHFLMGYFNGLRGMDPSFPITMMSMFGIVALSGVVVNDAIVYIEAANGRIGGGMPIHEALVQAGIRRFRAIVLTTLTTAIGLAPLILERSFQAQFLVPMALSIAFGVVFATFITLLLVPCLLMILNDLRRAGVWIVRGRIPEREEVEPAANRESEIAGGTV